MNEDNLRNEGRAFRIALGLVVMTLAGGGFAALFFIKVPPENKDAMMFALGNVFGWAASVVSSEYGATATGRKVAEAAVRNIERRDVASSTEEPLPVKVVAQAEDEPLPVTDKEDK